MINYFEKFELVNTPQEIIADCNSLTIVNIGTVNAVVNGLTVTPGSQYYAPGNETEFNTTRYRLSFVAAGTQEVLVIRKIYK
jgi:hypothetical protein